MFSQDAGEPFQEIRFGLEFTASADHRGLHSVDDADSHNFANNSVEASLLLRLRESLFVFVCPMRRGLYVKN